MQSLHSSASPNIQVKKKYIIISQRVFPLKLKHLPTSLCFVSCRGRHIIQELGTVSKRNSKETEQTVHTGRERHLKLHRHWIYR